MTTINELELASDLAHRELIKLFMINTENAYTIEEAESLVVEGENYIEIYQDEFNILYEEFLDIIEKTKE